MTLFSFEPHKQQFFSLKSILKMQIKLDFYQFRNETFLLQLTRPAKIVSP